MLKQRVEIAQHVAKNLFEAEAAIDVALAKVAALSGSMSGMREGAGLSAMFGQGAVERAIDTMGALAQARRGIVEAHKELDATRIQMGLRTLAMGGLMPKPLEELIPSGLHIAGGTEAKAA